MLLTTSAQLLGAPGYSAEQFKGANLLGMKYQVDTVAR